MVLVLFAILALTASATNPGVRAGVSIEAVETFKDNVLPVIFDNIGSITIPSVSGKAGPIDIEVSNIVLSGLGFAEGETKVTTNPPSTVGVSVGGITGQVSFYFHYSFLFVHDHASGSAGVSSTNAAVNIQVHETDGRPDIRIADIDVDIGDIDVHIGGDVIADVANWIVNLIKGSLKGTIESAVSGAIKGAAIQALDKFLGQLPLVVEIPGTGLGLNYTLTGDSVIGDNYGEQGSIGQVVVFDDPTDFPPIPLPAPMDSFDPNGQGLQVRLSDYTINSGLYAVYKTGIINFLIKASMIPSNSPVHLDTTTLGIIIPALPEKYGHGKPCDVRIQTANDWPRVSLSNNGTEKSGEAAGKVYAALDLIVENNGTAISVDGEVSFDVDMFLEDWILRGSIGTASVDTLKVTNSTLGDLDATNLASLINLVLNVTIPAVNSQYLTNGIPLPKVPHVSFADSAVYIKEGYVLAETTPEYAFEELAAFLSEPRNINYPLEDPNRLEPSYNLILGN